MTAVVIPLASSICRSPSPHQARSAVSASSIREISLADRPAAPMSRIPAPSQPRCGTRPAGPHPRSARPGPRREPGQDDQVSRGPQVGRTSPGRRPAAARTPSDRSTPPVIMDDRDRQRPRGETRGLPDRKGRTSGDEHALHLGRRPLQSLRCRSQELPPPARNATGGPASETGVRPSSPTEGRQELSISRTAL